MFPVLPVHFSPGKPEIGFIDKCSCLEGVVGPLPPHVGSRQSMEFVIHEREEPLLSRGIAGTHGL
jgi:hypothetical protein